MSQASETPERKSQTGEVAAVCLGLVLAVAVVFGQTAGFGFVNYDDDRYIYENSHVTGGLTGADAGWALVEHSIDYWHPLTWLSHMADCQVFQLWAGGHHLTNVALHAAAAVLLFLAWREMTGAPWRSAFVAAVFAVHPLRAESVVWVTERKDVLSGVFFMAALWFYARYAARPSGRRYALVAAAFGLGLCAKNSLVALPFLFILLDWWPLRRVERPGGGFIAEKIPLLMLAAGSCFTTRLLPPGNSVILQFPFLERAGNAVVSYAVYIRQMIFPVKLAIPYPFPAGGQPPWKIGLAVFFLAAISVWALAGQKRRPYLLVGWLWYLGMLFPMVGFVQISYYAHADRYTYLSQIGLAIAATWAVADWSAGWKYRTAVLGSVAAAVLGTLMVCAWTQAGYWRNSETLWGRAFACTANNFMAQYNMGNVLRAEGKLDEAIAHYQQAVQALPTYEPALNNLGTALRQKGRLDEAIELFQRAIKSEPGDESVYFNLARTFYQAGRTADAISQYESALRLDASDVEAQNNLAWLLATTGQAALRNGPQAVQLALEANNRSGGRNPVILGTLAAALAETGQFSEAADTARRAWQTALAQSNTALAAQLQAQMNDYLAGRPHRSP